MKTMVRGPGEGLTVTVSLLGVYKTGGLDLPSPPSGTSLKFYVPCRQMPPMKKGKAHGNGVGAEHTLKVWSCQINQEDAFTRS